jgi:hypothetical protein
MNAYRYTRVNRRNPVQSTSKLAVINTFSNTRIIFIVHRLEDFVEHVEMGDDKAPRGNLNIQ